MRTFLIANPKGGCGKSTLSVHLATWFARCEEVVYLADLDRQQSSRYWIDSRPSGLPPVRVWEIDDTESISPPKDGSIGIIDSPAGLHGKALKQVLSEVDRIIVPVSPSRFDMQASRDFFEALAGVKAIRKEKVGVAVVGMRVDRRANSTLQLVDFLQGFDLPLVTCVRSAQRYVQALDTGSTIFDGYRIPDSDWEDWQPLIDWLVSRR